MYIKQIRLEQFRNLLDQEIEFDPGINILTGNNAQGKTNIIEAIWLFSACKSFRTNNEKDFIFYQANHADLDLLFYKNNRFQSASFRYYERKKREMYLNEIKVKPSELIGNFLSVLFFPEHLNLVKEGPDVRRKFLDFAICQVKPRYFALLSEYNKTLYQRNNVLKSEEESILKTLDVWDEKLAVLGTEIFLFRKKYVQMLHQYGAAVIDEMTQGRETLCVEYKSFTLESDDRNWIQQQLLNKIRNSREKDLRYGYTNEGPHKDDLELSLNGRSAKAFGSQGQQRSCVMALKLAEAEILNDFYDEYPVLLFDDVFSELDQKRKNYIIQKIKEKQVIITACEQIQDFSGARLFEIDHGEVKVL